MSDRNGENKLYAVIFPHQEPQIRAWCWGKSCGKGLVGAIDLGPTAAVGCRQDDCPYLDKQMDEPMGELAIGGESVSVYLRKLKDVGQLGSVRKTFNRV